MTLAGDVAEGEQLQELLVGSRDRVAARARRRAPPETALDDPPLRVLVAESEVDEARDAIEALVEPEDELDE